MTAPKLNQPVRLRRITDGQIVLAVRTDCGLVDAVADNGDAYRALRDKFLIDGEKIFSDVDAVLVQAVGNVIRVQEAAAVLKKAGYEIDEPAHDYLSTACLHALHDRCRMTCKFCNAPCRCECHEPRHDRAQA